MALFTAKLTAIWETMVGDQWSLTGRTNVYLPNTARVVNADLYNDKVLTISGGISAQEVTWSPFGASAPATMMMFNADQPCDIRTNSPSDTNFLSGIQLMYLCGYISSVYVTTGSAATTIRVAACGGSNAAISVTYPLP